MSKRTYWKQHFTTPGTCFPFEYSSKHLTDLFYFEKIRIARFKTNIDSPISFQNWAQNANHYSIDYMGFVQNMSINFYEVENNPVFLDFQFL